MFIFIGTYLSEGAGISKNIPKSYTRNVHFRFSFFGVVLIYLTALRQMHKQASSRAMNTVVAAAFSEGVNMYIRLCMYILLCYTYTEYVYIYLFI